MTEPERPKSGRPRSLIRLIRWSGGIVFLLLVSAVVWFWLNHRRSNATGASNRLNGDDDNGWHRGGEEGRHADFLQGLGTAKILVDTLEDAVIVPTAAIQLGAPGPTSTW